MSERIYWIGIVSVQTTTSTTLEPVTYSVEKEITYMQKLDTRVRCIILA